MSRKDYVALAESIRRQYEVSLSSGTQETLRAIRNIAQMQAEVFYADNPNFNREKFLYAALGDQ